MKYLYIAMLSFWLAACSKPEPSSFSGYIEAEYTRVASPMGGRLLALNVQRGGEVKVGDPLFVLESNNEAAAVQESQARLSRSTAMLADQSKGKRLDEIAVLQTQYDAAHVALKQAEDDVQRQQELAQSGYTSGANLEKLQSQLKLAQVRQQEAAAQLKVAQLAAREDAQKAAAADVQASKALLAQAQWRLAQKSISAPVAAQVEDTLYRVGEWVPAGMPVVTLLEANAMKVRFFIPQAKLPLIKQGAVISVACDGCQPFKAHISYIANTAEFTPPVIYSKENRAKLVFLVEAKPESNVRLAPGQAVDVWLESP